MVRFERWANALWSGMKTRRQVEALGPAAAADFGVTLADVAATARQPGDVAERIARMAAVFGVEAALTRLDRYHAQDMARTCAGCPSRAVCARALHRADLPAVAQVDFCPNAPAYRALAA